MQSRTAVIITGIALTGAALAACSNSESGQPTPTNAGQQESQQHTDGADNVDGGAPAVSDPVDTSRFQQAPCDTLTADQVKSLTPQAGNGEPDKGVAGPECTWDDDQNGVRVTIAFAVNGSGLSTIYKKRDTLELFKELPDVRGHPAVLQSAADLRAQGQCGADVGLTDDLSLTVSVILDPDNPDYSNPCPTAQQTLKEAMKTIKGAQ